MKHEEHQNETKNEIGKERGQMNMFDKLSRCAMTW